MDHIFNFDITKYLVFFFNSWSLGFFYKEKIQTINKPFAKFSLSVLFALFLGLTARYMLR